jgi:dephospho-CoA kinase
MKSILAENRPIYVDAVYCAAEFDFLKTLVPGIPFLLIGIEMSLPIRLARLMNRVVRPLSETELRARDAMELTRLNTGEVMTKAAVSITNDGPLAEFQSTLMRALSRSG